MGVVELLPIASQGELAVANRVQVPRIGVLLQQPAVGVVGLGILVREELALGLQKQSVLLQGRVGRTVGRGGELGRRILVLLVAEERSPSCFAARAIFSSGP